MQSDTVKVTIDIRDFTARPRSISLPLGGTVKFVSSQPDKVTQLHLQLANSNTSKVVYSAAAIGGGKTCEYTLQEPGQYEFTSEVYGFLRGSVKVMDSPAEPAPRAEEEPATGPASGDTQLITHSSSSDHAQLGGPSSSQSTSTSPQESSGQDAGDVASSVASNEHQRSRLVLGQGSAAGPAGASVLPDVAALNVKRRDGLSSMPNLQIPLGPSASEDGAAGDEVNTPLSSAGAPSSVSTVRLTPQVLSLRTGVAQRSSSATGRSHHGSGKGGRGTGHHSPSLAHAHEPKEISADAPAAAAAALEAVLAATNSPRTRRSVGGTPLSPGTGPSTPTRGPVHHMGGPLIEAGAEMIHGPGLSMQHMQTSYSGDIDAMLRGRSAPPYSQQSGHGSPYSRLSGDGVGAGMSAATNVVTNFLNSAQQMHRRSLGSSPLSRAGAAGRGSADDPLSSRTLGTQSPLRPRAARASAPSSSPLGQSNSLPLASQQMHMDGMGVYGSVPMAYGASPQYGTLLSQGSGPGHMSPVMHGGMVMYGPGGMQRAHTTSDWSRHLAEQAQMAGQHRMHGLQPGTNVVPVPVPVPVAVMVPVPVATGMQQAHMVSPNSAQISGNAGGEWGPTGPGGNLTSPRPGLPPRPQPSGSEAVTPAHSSRSRRGHESSRGSIGSPNSPGLSAGGGDLCHEGDTGAAGDSQRVSAEQVAGGEGAGAAQQSGRQTSGEDDIWHDAAGHADSEQGDVEGEIEIPYVPMTGPDEDETVALADAESRLSSLTMHTASDASAAGLGTSAGSTSRPLEPLGSHFSVPLTETSTSATKAHQGLDLGKAAGAENGASSSGTAQGQVQGVERGRSRRRETTTSGDGHDSAPETSSSARPRGTQGVPTGTLRGSILSEEALRTHASAGHMLLNDSDSRFDRSLGPRVARSEGPDVVGLVDRTAPHAAYGLAGRLGASGKLEAGRLGGGGSSGELKNVRSGGSGGLGGRRSASREGGRLPRGAEDQAHPGWKTTQDFMGSLPDVYIDGPVYETNPREWSWQHVYSTTGLPSALAIQVPQQLGTFARAAHWRAYPRLTTAAQCAACPRQFHSPLNAHRCELRHEAGDALALAAPQQGKAGKGSKSSKRPGTGITSQGSQDHSLAYQQRTRDELSRFWTNLVQKQPATALHVLALRPLTHDLSFDFAGLRTGKDASQYWRELVGRLLDLTCSHWVLQGTRKDNLFRHKDNIYKYYLRMHALSYAMTQARSELSQAAEAGSSKGEAKAGPVQPNFTLPTWEDINSCLEKVTEGQLFTTPYTKPEQPWTAFVQTHLSNVLDKERAQTVSDTDALLALLLELSLLGALQKERDETEARARSLLAEEESAAESRRKAAAAQAAKQKEKPSKNMPVKKRSNNNSDSEAGEDDKPAASAAKGAAAPAAAAAAAATPPQPQAAPTQPGAAAEIPASAANVTDAAQRTTDTQSAFQVAKGRGKHAPAAGAGGAPLPPPPHRAGDSRQLQHRSSSELPGAAGEAGSGRNSGSGTSTDEGYHRHYPTGREIPAHNPHAGTGAFIPSRPPRAQSSYTEQYGGRGAGGYGGAPRPGAPPTSQRASTASSPSLSQRNSHNEQLGQPQQLQQQQQQMRAAYQRGHSGSEHSLGQQQQPHQQQRGQPLSQRSSGEVPAAAQAQQQRQGQVSQQSGGQPAAAAMVSQAVPAARQPVQQSAPARVQAAAGSSALAAARQQQQQQQQQQQAASLKAAQTAAAAPPKPATHGDQRPAAQAAASNEPARAQQPHATPPKLQLPAESSQPPEPSPARPGPAGEHAVRQANPHATNTTPHGHSVHGRMTQGPRGSHETGIRTTASGQVSVVSDSGSHTHSHSHPQSASQSEHGGPSTGGGAGPAHAHPGVPGGLVMPVGMMPGHAMGPQGQIMMYMPGQGPVPVMPVVQSIPGQPPFVQYMAMPGHAGQQGMTMMAPAGMQPGMIATPQGMIAGYNMQGMQVPGPAMGFPQGVPMAQPHMVPYMAGMPAGGFMQHPMQPMQPMQGFSMPGMVPAPAPASGEPVVFMPHQQPDGAAAAAASTPTGMRMPAPAMGMTSPTMIQGQPLIAQQVPMQMQPAAMSQGQHMVPVAMAQPQPPPASPSQPAAMPIPSPSQQRYSHSQGPRPHQPHQPQQSHQQQQSHQPHQPPPPPHITAQRTGSGLQSYGSYGSYGTSPKLPGPASGAGSSSGQPRYDRRSGTTLERQSSGGSHTSNPHAIPVVQSPHGAQPRYSHGQHGERPGAQARSFESSNSGSLSRQGSMQAATRQASTGHPAPPPPPPAQTTAAAQAVPAAAPPSKAAAAAAKAPSAVAATAMAAAAAASTHSSGGHGAVTAGGGLSSIAENRPRSGQQQPQPHHQQPAAHVVQQAHHAAPAAQQPARPAPVAAQPETARTQQPPPPPPQERPQRQAPQQPAQQQQQQPSQPAAAPPQRPAGPPDARPQRAERAPEAPAAAAAAPAAPSGGGKGGFGGGLQALLDNAFAKGPQSRAAVSGVTQQGGKGPAEAEAEPASRQMSRADQAADELSRRWREALAELDD